MEKPVIDSSIESLPKSAPKVVSLSKSPETRESSRAALAKTAFFAAMVLASLYVLIPNHFSLLPTHGLDPSWKYALHIAYSEGLIWGRDLVFTYGPLGILSSRLSFPNASWLYVLCDLFVLGNLAWILTRAASRMTHIWQGVALFLCVACVGWNGLSIELPLTLLTIELFHLFEFMNLSNEETKKNLNSSKASIHFLLAGVCATASFYIKLNAGIIALVFLAFSGAMVWALKDEVPKLFRSTVFGLVSLNLILALLLPVDLPAFLMQAPDIIKGYNDSLFVTLSGRGHFLILAWSMLAGFLLTALFSLPLLLKSTMNLAQMAMAGATLFMLYKQGFVRADGHESTFFHYLPIVAGLLYLSWNNELRNRAGVLCLFGLGAAFSHMHPFMNKQWIIEESTGPVRYIEQMTSSTHATTKLPPSRIPATFREIIGQSSVDIIPWEISHVAAAGMNLEMRPVMQSYAASTARLEYLNYQKYLSDTAPEFVILSVNCIDGRYCFSVETLTKWALLQKYTLLRDTEQFLLFRRHSRELEPKTEEVKKSEDAVLGQWQPVPEAGEPKELFLKASPNYTWLGKIRTQLYKPAELRLKLKLASGRIINHRISRENLITGIPIGLYVPDTKAAASYFSYSATPLEPVSEFMLYTPARIGFKSEYKYLIESWTLEEKNL